MSKEKNKRLRSRQETLFMNNLDKKLQMSGFIAFFLSGICSISSGIVVSLLQERYGFDYNVTGTLLSIMSIGNLMAGFATGVLPAKIGLKATIITLSAGYELGYLWLGISGWMSILVLSFLLIGFAKGSVINMCTILVSNHSKNRTKGMNIMHSCYALGALLCPFIIAGAGLIGPVIPMLSLSFLGLVMWIIFQLTPIEKKTAGKKEKTDWDFLKSKLFCLITGLIFCQNAAEISVNGWLVTYFKGSGILSGTLSAYTVTVMWTATLIARLLIAFVFPLKNPYMAMIKMAVSCTLFYICLMMADNQIAAILLLFAFAFSMAGMNPTAVACAGKMTSVASIGVMLPAASFGGILMPWIIGIVSNAAGLKTGMAMNIISCVGMLIFCIAVKRLKDE